MFSGLSILNSTVSGNSASATGTTGAAQHRVGGIDGRRDWRPDRAEHDRRQHGGCYSSGGVTIPAGGILIDNSSTAIRSSTIARNGPTSGTLDGVNLFATTSASVGITNSIIAVPRGGGHNCLAIVSAVIATSGFNDDFSDPGGPSCFTIAANG